MPTYNSIQTSRLENYIRRLLGVRNGGIVPTVAPELGVDVTLPQLEDALALAGYVPFGLAHNVAAVAAQFGAASVFNATAAQLLVLQFTASANGNAIIYNSVGPSLGLGLLPAANAMWRDTRRAAAAFPLNAAGLSVTDGTLAAIPPGAHNMVAAGRVLANTVVQGPWLVLSPGQGAAVWADLANVAFTWQAEGYVRDMIPDELVI